MEVVDTSSLAAQIMRLTISTGYVNFAETYAKRPNQSKLINYSKPKLFSEAAPPSILEFNRHAAPFFVTSMLIMP